MLQGDLGLKGYSEPHEQYTDEQYTDEQCPYQAIPGQKPGSGAFAKVYQAKIRNIIRLQQIFALKEILVKDEGWLKDVTEEIRILKPLRHPNILVLKEAFYSKLDPCTVYLATLPWAPQSLYDFFWNVLGPDRLHDDEWYVPGGLDQWPSIVFQCSWGLAYLHSEKIKHKDLKPHNILLHREKIQDKSQNGEIMIRPIIADFGLSKNFKPGGETNSYGTHEFMAPEQLRPDQRSELHSDIWSLGCCFAFIWILVHSGKKGLADLWEKIMRSNRDERGFHTESNRKATHELLETSLTLPKDPGMIAFMQEFGALVKDMLNVKSIERPEAWIIALRLIRLEKKWVETQQRLAIEKVLEQEHPNMLSSMVDLGSTSQDLKQRMEDADKLYAQVIQTKQRAPEQVPHSELDAMANLASELSSQGLSEEAERFYLQVMELKKMVLGRDDRSTIHSMADLLRSYCDPERFEEIEILIPPLVDLRNTELEQEDPHALDTMTYLVGTWWVRGHIGKALQLMDTLERSKLKLGPKLV